MFDFLDYSGVDDESEDDFSDPRRFARGVGLLDGYGSTPKAQADYVGVSYDTPDLDFSFTAPSGSVVSDSNEDVYGRYKKILGESSPALGMIQDYISRRPKQEDYKAGWGRKLLAAVAGISAGDPVKGYGVARGIAEEPWKQALQNYADEGKFVDDAARLADRQHTEKIRSAQFDMTLEARRENQRKLRNEAERRQAEIERKNREAEVDRDLSRKDKERDFKLRERAENRQGAEFEDTRKHRRFQEGMEIVDKLNPLKILKGVTSTTPKPLSPGQQTAAFKLRHQQLLSRDPQLARLFYDPVTGKMNSTPTKILTGEELSDEENALYQKYLQVVRQ